MHREQSLTARQQAIVPIAAFTACGDMSQLAASLQVGLDAGPPTQKLVIPGLVGVLKSPPTGYVQHEHGVVARISTLDVGKEVLKRFTSFDRQPTFAEILITAHDGHPVGFGIPMDRRQLVGRGILPALRRHADVGRDARRARFRRSRQSLGHDGLPCVSPEPFNLRR
jgi:hypothetical protein